MRHPAHAQHQLSNMDYEGHGVYEHDYLGMGAFGQLPDLGALQTHTTISGLAQVEPSQAPAIKQALQLMTFTPTDSPELGGVSGTASYILGSTGGPWIDDLIMEGYVVMVEKASIPTGAIRVVATDQPPSIVMLAKSPPGMWVIVDGYSTPLQQARALATGTPPQSLPPGEPSPQQPGGGSIPSGQGCPPNTIPVAGTCYPVPPCDTSKYDEIYGVCLPKLGSGIPTQPPTPGGEEPPAPGAHRPPCDPSETERNGWCFPPSNGDLDPTPGGPGPGPSDKAKMELPKWALPVAVGVGVVGLGALVYAATRSKARAPRQPSPQPVSTTATMRSNMARNRRRYKAWG